MARPGSITAGQAEWRQYNGVSSGSGELRTVLFTDIEGSTVLLRSFGEAYFDVLETHRGLIRAAITGHEGT